MATNKDKITDRPVLPMNYGASAEFTAKDAVLADALERAIWDPDTGRWMILMENGKWIQLPMDDSGNLIPIMPDKRFTP